MATNFNLSAVHALKHPLHSLSSCTGGTINDIKSVVNTFGNKQGTSTGALLAYNTAISIANQNPICSIWYCPSNNVDHSMNIIGYKYDTANNYDFKYVLHDPDSSTNQNPLIIPSGYNATSVSYIRNGKTYTWSSSIYNWS